MRNDFVRQLLIEMERDPEIVLLTGDLGFRAFEPVQAAYPDRFINVGIAEANMVGMAAGLALTGKKPIVYSIASFATMRCYEQIRTDVCYHNLNVKIIGVGGGVNYAHQGVTHHTIEDVAIMRALPNMTVICPGYSWEATEATKTALRTEGPAYLRLGKSPSVNYAKEGFEFAIGKGFTIKEGSDIVIIATGNILDLALATAVQTEEATGKTVGVISMPTIKPIDANLIRRIANNARAMFTLEEHTIIGGLGSAVAEVLATSSLPHVTFAPFGFQDRFVTEVGSRDYLLSCAGLDATQLCDAIVKKLTASSS